MSLVRYRIDGIEFSIASPKQIVESSVLEVTEPNLYSKGIPNAGACNDLRLGTVDRRFRCGTCRNSSQICMGHNGHINLGFPVYHWLCMEKILKLLRSVCFWCSATIVDFHDSDIQRRFSTVRKACKLPSAISMYSKKKKCHKCDGCQPSYDKEGLSIVTAWDLDDLSTEEEKEIAKKRFNAKIARDILRFVSDEDCRYLGLNPDSTRPENMILTVLLVPSVIIRPTTMISEGSRTKGHDDLTTLLRDIVKFSNLVKEQLKDEPDNLALAQNDYEQLVVHISTYFDKDGGATTSTMCLGGTGVSRTTRRHITRSGPLKSLGKRLGGKRGRFRGSIVGKRSNFTSRSVITPEPWIDIWQLVVPKLVARTQTVPEPVTTFNIQQLRQIVIRGDHPDGLGAHHVVRPDGTSINLKMCKDREILARALSTTGWVVHRHVRTGDWCIFNRQPTLHKMGMMAHEIIVGTGNTFMLPVPTTTPYNADFDGDEMNLHVLQNPLAVAEAKEIMSVPQCLISPKDSKPVMSPVQDAVIGTYLMTKKDTFMSRGRFFDLSMLVRYGEKPIPLPAVYYKDARGKWEGLYTGKQLCSYYIPENIHLARTTRNLDDSNIASCFDTDERYVRIQNGEVMCGQLCKGIIGGVSRGIIQRTAKRRGNWQAAKLISDMQRVATRWLAGHGFSIGISDCIHSAAAQKEVDEIIQNTYERVKEGKEKARKNNFSEGAIEGEVQNIFSSVLNSVAVSVLSTIPHDNNIRMCVESGAKGKKLNICQIHGCVGQQVVSGTRTRHRKDFGARTFPSFQRGDDDPTAFGFCPQSYVQGLTPITYFTHSQGGREGMIDTACKTAETGYIQRRLITILQSEKTAFDGTVRDANNGIVMFRYGGDGMDPEKLIKVSTPVLAMSGSPHDVAVKWCGKDGTEAQRLAEVITIAKEAASVFGLNAIKHIHIPFDVYDYYQTFSRGSLLSAEDVVPLVEEMENALIKLVGNKLSVNHILVHLRSTLVSKRLPGVSLEKLKEVLHSCLEMAETSVCQGGTMCGTIAAQSIGEPATQMTLNTFHSAGTGNRTVMRGVPRFKEVIDCTKNPKGPSLTVHLNDDISQSKRLSSNIARGMKKLLFAEVVQDRSVFYDPDDTVVPEDHNIVERYRIVCGDTTVDALPWVCRIRLDPTKMTGISIRDVTRAIRTMTTDRAIVIASEPNEPKCIIRIRPLIISNLKKCMAQVTDEEEKLKLEKMAVTDMCDAIIENARISGLENIRGTYVSKKNQRFLIETEGTDFQEVISSGDAIDASKTLSNNVHDIMPVLGISASAIVLFHEAHAVLTAQGAYISPRHLELLALKMCYSGTPIPVTRHGMAKTEHGVLLRASFERTVDTFMESAMHSAVDPCTGICESIVMGQVPPMGTGAIDILEVNLPTRSKRKTIGEEEFIGRRKRKVVPEPKKRRWKEKMVWEQSWDYTMDPKRLFNLFNIKYNCQHQSTFTPQFGNQIQPVSPVYHPTSPKYNPMGPQTYNPNSPEYHPTTPPLGPFTPDYNPNSPQYDPNKNYGATPPFENHFEVETPPMTPPMSDLSPEFTTDPVWDNEQPEHTEEIASTNSLPDTEWKVTLQSPCTNNKAGLLPWVVHPTSPKI